MVCRSPRDQRVDSRLNFRFGWKRDVVGVAGSFIILSAGGMFLAFLFPLGYKTVLALLACVGAAWLAIRQMK